MNRAFDGDVVAIELLPEKEWSSAAEIVLEDEGYDPGDTLVNNTFMLTLFFGWSGSLDKVFKVLGPLPNR